MQSTVPVETLLKKKNYENADSYTDNNGVSSNDKNTQRRVKMKTGGNDTGKTVILKYANRKHYNTETSSYVTLPQVLALGVDNFIVIDHVTKKDITFNVLVNALSGHFLNNPEAFETVKPAIVEKLGLGAPSLPTNN